MNMKSKQSWLLLGALSLAPAAAPAWLRAAGEVIDMPGNGDKL